MGRWSSVPVEDTLSLGPCGRVACQQDVRGHVRPGDRLHAAALTGLEAVLELHPQLWGAAPAVCAGDLTSPLLSLRLAALSPAFGSGTRLKLPGPGTACGLQLLSALCVRSRVWAEPCLVQAAQEEYDGIIEDFLLMAEKLFGPYVWGRCVCPRGPLGPCSSPGRTCRC